MSRLTIYRDDYSDATIVSNQFIDEYMENANDAQIKVYLYLLRMMHANLPTSISDIADKFNHTEKDVVRALSYWERRIWYGSNMTKTARSLPCICSPALLLRPLLRPVQRKPLQKPHSIRLRRKLLRRRYSRQKQALLQPGRGYILSTGRGSFPDYFIAEQYLGRVLTVPDIKTIIFLYKGLHFRPT